MEAYGGQEKLRKLHNQLEEGGQGASPNFIPRKSTEKPLVLGTSAPVSASFAIKT